MQRTWRRGACACSGWVSTNSHPVICRLCTIGMLIHILPLGINMLPFMRTWNPQSLPYMNARWTLKNSSAHRTLEFFCLVELVCHLQPGPRTQSRTHSFCSWSAEATRKRSVAKSTTSPAAPAKDAVAGSHLRSAAERGRFSAAQAAAPPVEVLSVPAGRSPSREPPPPSALHHCLRALCAVVESRHQLLDYRQSLMTVPRSEPAVPAPLRRGNAFAHDDHLSFTKEVRQCVLP